MTDLTNRLRADIETWEGHYSDEMFPRYYPAPPLQIEAAEQIERDAALLRQALEALGSSLYPQPRQMAAIVALKAALAEHYCDTHCTWADHAPGCVRAEPLEPVAWGVFGANLHDMFFTEEEAHEMAMLKGDGSTVAPLYATPPQRKPLSDEEIENLNVHYLMTHAAKVTITRAIEQAHQIGVKT